MKVWVSKYALTKGLFEAEVETSGEYAYQRMGSYSVQYKVGRDCFETLAEAERQADRMRVAKIASLRKQIAKLETAARLERVEKNESR